MLQDLQCVNYVKLNSTLIVSLRKYALSIFQIMTFELIWNKIPISQVELSLATVLRCGQTFRWKFINNTWSFSLKDRVVLLKQDENSIQYTQIGSKNHQETLAFINDYFTLDTNLSNLYTFWSSQHLLHSKLKLSPFDSFKGIRILRQDPWECLISFICSSNNNVKRISKMCDSLCTEFGDYIAEYQGTKYYSFPTPNQLSQPDVEYKLREYGFGYRAKYIHQTAIMLTSTLSIDELNSLREKDYETAHLFLLQLMGVGPKVADCICLMSLDKHDIVPVDTHVYQIAIRDYKFKGNAAKALNKNQYNAIRAHFKEIFGDYAGWAQSVLFAADLSDLNNGINILESDTKAVKIETDTKAVKIEAGTKAIKIETDTGSNSELNERKVKRIKVEKSENGVIEEKIKIEATKSEESGVTSVKVEVKEEEVD